MASKLRIALLQVELLCFPLPPAAAASLLWYVLYCKGIHLHPRLDGIATSAWIPVFGTLYAIVAGLVLYAAWGDYQTMETAVRKGDREAFLDLRDKRIPVPIHTTLLAFAMSLLAGLMLLNYPDAVSGLCCVSSTAYLLSLTFFAIREMDDPCHSGIWRIENIPKEWLKTSSRTGPPNP